MLASICILCLHILHIHDDSTINIIILIIIISNFLEWYQTDIQDHKDNLQQQIDFINTEPCIGTMTFTGHSRSSKNDSNHDSHTIYY